MDSSEYNDEIERLEAPTVDSLSREVSTADAHDKPPSPQNPHPESTPEPPTNPQVPVPDSEETGIGESAEAHIQPQATFEATEVCRYLIKRAAW